MMGLIFRAITPYFVTFRSETLDQLFTALCLFAGIMVGFFSYWIGKTSLLKTIFEISNFSKRLSQGDFTSNLIINSNDEIGKFANYYNELIQQMKISLQGIQKLSFEINSTMLEQKKSTIQLSQNTSSLALDYDVLNEETLQNAKDLDYSVSHFKILQFSMENLMNEIQLLSNSITDLKEISDLSIQEILSYEMKFEKLDKNLKFLKTQMEGISLSSEKIAKTIGKVHTISDKINLLSLNAAIESARAGEHGAGFAVVSEEISKLASQTRVSLKEIQSLFNSNLEEVKKGTDAFETSFESIAEIITDSKKIVANFQSLGSEMKRQIVKQVTVSTEANESIEISNTIATNLAHFQISFEKIKTIIQEMNLLGAKNAQAAEEISLSSKDISEYTSDLEKNVKFYKF